MAGELYGRLEVIQAELSDVRKRLEKLCEAIESQEPQGPWVKDWQERQDSNPRPAVLETAALPAELRSCVSL